jgi:hypothetical protein
VTGLADRAKPRGIAGACGGGSSLPESFDLVGYVAHCIVVGNIFGSNIATIVGICQAVKTIIGITNVSSAILKHSMRRLRPQRINKGWRMASEVWLGLETCHSSQMKTAPQQA